MRIKVACGHLPAEWERHEATYIVWPHNRDDWPGKMSAVGWVYAEIVKNISPGENIIILVSDKRKEERVKSILNKSGVDLENISFMRAPTNRSWIRDFGPLFVRCGKGKKKLAIVDFAFNGWARYRSYQKDDKATKTISERLSLNRFIPKNNGCAIVLEGGAIDVNGAGTLITTEECLLDKNVQARNPGMTRAEYEKLFHEFFGVNNVIWLGGGIDGDDTHGHVDDICRFVSKDTIVVAYEKNRSDVNYRPLNENLERLQGAQLEDGSKPEIVTLPMPAPQYFDGQRLPASYANFYIANNAVIVPTYNDPADAKALGILGELFNDRPVIGVHSVDLVLGLGAIHCLTMQKP